MSTGQAPARGEVWMVALGRAVGGNSRGRGPP
jgi:hypothetical protein